MVNEEANVNIIFNNKRNIKHNCLIYVKHIVHVHLSRASSRSFITCSHWLDNSVPGVCPHSLALPSSLHTSWYFSRVQVAVSFALTTTVNHKDISSSVISVMTYTKLTSHYYMVLYVCIDAFMSTSKLKVTKGDLLQHCICENSKPFLSGPCLLI